ncbi:MAG: hypothetical protein QM784_13270 [Polyangiaceae bacterium]
MGQAFRRLGPILLVMFSVVSWSRRTHAQLDEHVDLVGNIYCRSSPAAGERPWGGVRVFVKGRPDLASESDPEHGRFRISIPARELADTAITLIYAQSNLLLREEPTRIDRNDTLILAGRPTAQIAPRIFIVPYCVELETPRLREMVRGLVDQISHRAALVHEELMRAHNFGSPETASCLDDVLSRMGAHLRQAESRVPAFMDALGEDMLRARREVTRIKIADERAQELAAEADYCLEHHAPHPGQDSNRYLPDLTISPAELTAIATEPVPRPHQWDHERPARAAATPPNALTLTMGAAFETGYDSNFLQQNGSTVVPGWQFRPTAHFGLEFFDARRVATAPNTERVAPTFVANASVLGLILSGIDDSRPGLAKHSNLGVTSELFARLLGDARGTLTLSGQYVRRIEPRAEPEFQSTRGQNDFSVGADASLALGAGQFDVGTGYRLGYTLYDEATQTYADRIQQRLALRERFRFLPESAFVHETELRATSFVNADSSLHDNTELRTQVGFSGMFGERFGLTTLVGWAQSDYSARTSAGAVTEYDGVIGRAKLSWFFGPVSKSAYDSSALARPELTLGFDRDYRQGVLTDHYLRNRVGADLILTHGPQLLWRFELGVSHVAYPVAPVGSEAHITGADSEYRTDAGVGLEYEPIEHLRFTLRGDAYRVMSDVAPVFQDGRVGSTLAFQRVQLFGGAVVSN